MGKLRTSTYNDYMAYHATCSGCAAPDEIKESRVFLSNVGSRLAGRYEVLEVLGEGTFGRVCRCLDLATGGFVAVKIVVTEDWVDDIYALNEVIILQQLSQSAICLIKTADDRTSMTSITSFE